jgi:hypothetical protein
MNVMGVTYGESVGHIVINEATQRSESLAEDKNSRFREGRSEHPYVRAYAHNPERGAPENSTSRKARATRLHQLGVSDCARLSNERRRPYRIEPQSEV